MDKKEKLIEVLKNLGDNEKIDVYNEYLNKTSFYDDYIYHNYEFNEVMEGKTPEEIALAIQYGDYQYNIDYFCFNGYGNLQSIYNLDEYIDYDALASYIIENNENFNYYELSEFLEGEENE